MGNSLEVRCYGICFELPHNTSQPKKGRPLSLHDTTSHWLHGNSIPKIWLPVWLAWNNSPSSYKHHPTHYWEMGLFVWGLAPNYKSMQIWQHFCTIEFNGLYSGLTNRCKVGKCFYTIKFSGLYCIRLIDYTFLYESGLTNSCGRQFPRVRKARGKNKWSPRRGQEQNN
jgi:hypothetical protein